MDRLHVVTSRGPVALVGHLHASPPRPSLLVIGGAFPPASFKHELVDLYPGANVLIGQLPGMDSPWLKERTVEAAAAAYDEAITRLLPNDPIVALGVSAGCLVTLSLKAPNIVRHILDEPFLSTAGLWPIVEKFRERLEAYPNNQKLEELLWNVFGLNAEKHVERSYSHLIDGLLAPADVIVGGMLLEPRRDIEGWPSLTSSADRHFLAANPFVTMHVGPSGRGHGFGDTDVGRKTISALTLKALLAAASGLSDRYRA